MPGLKDILSGLLGEGSIARQFFVWNVLGSVASTALQPFLQEVSNAVNANHPTVPLSPSDLATMVLRELITRDQAAPIAAMSGVSADDLDLLVANAGSGPSIPDLFLLWREGKIGDADLDQGLARAGVATEWYELVKDLAFTPPTAQQVLNAYLQGQITYDELVTRYHVAGADPTWLQAAIDSEGSAPTPDELTTMANRGVIPWTGTGPQVVSFEQGFLEGPWRNKWLAPYEKLAQYIPPPVQITSFVAGGYITDQQALQWYQQSGMTPDVAAAYLARAHGENVSSTKDLARSEITTLYQDQAISADQAIGMLGSLGYDQTNSQFILTITDLQRERKFLEAAISKIHSLYVGYKIDANAVLQSLTELEVPNEQITSLKNLWDIERTGNTKDLTAAQIVDAFYLELIDPPTALAKLEQIGYQPYDAWVLLSIKVKGPVPGLPVPVDTSLAQ